MSRSSPKVCPRQLTNYPPSFGIGIGMSYAELTHSLTDAFNTLADEAQGLNDRRIVLEHKLRFAHEQVSYSFSLIYPFLSLLVGFLSRHENQTCCPLLL